MNHNSLNEGTQARRHAGTQARRYAGSHSGILFTKQARAWPSTEPTEFILRSRPTAMMTQLLSFLASRSPVFAGQPRPPRRAPPIHTPSSDIPVRCSPLLNITSIVGDPVGRAAMSAYVQQRRLEYNTSLQGISKKIFSGTWTWTWTPSGDEPLAVE